MISVSNRIVVAVLAGALLVAPAFGAPTTDQNAGTWVDLYDDSDGIAPAMVAGNPFLIGGQPGQSGIVRDFIARLVTLDATSTGSWFTSEIEPASFDAWKSVYIDYTATMANQVKVEVWDVTAGSAGAVRRLGPVAPGPSDDPAFNGKIDLSGVPTSATRLRLRVLLADLGSPIAPTVSALKATFNTRSVLQIGLEAPAPSPSRRPSGDGIQMRMPVSVSYVNATGYVAYLSATTVADDRYNQTPALTFDSATLGGQWTAGGTTVQGVTIPPRSVYWSVPMQEAGKTYAYYATFRSPNGLVRDLAFNFEGRVTATNAATVTSSTRTVRMDAAPRTGLLKNAGGTFVIGGQHFARPDATITLTVSPHNWWNQNIFPGAQTYFQPVIWDTYQDFITQNVITQSEADGANVTPGSGGIKTITGTTINGIAIPPNSIYWLPGNLAPGQRLDLSYSIKLNYQGSQAGQAPFATVNDCSPSNEAWLATPQEALTGVNACAAGECAKRSACLPIYIGLDTRGQISFAKGDSLNGSTSIIGGGWNDNPQRFVTYGQAIEYKVAVANGGISTLDNVVIYDQVPANTTFVSAGVPVNNPSDPTAVAQNKIWYFTGTSATQPELYLAGGVTVDTSQWQATAPATVTWVAYELPRLRTSYCDGTAYNGTNNVIYNCTGKEPSAVTVDFTVITADDPNACTDTTITNTANVKVYRYTKPVTVANGTPLTEMLPAVLAPQPDSEPVLVRPLAADLSTSAGSGTPSAEPGTSAVHSITVQNRSAFNNPIDTARNVVATLTLPKVVANGIERVLDVASINTNGGLTTYGNGTITVRWPSIIPNASRTIELTYLLPTGIRNASTFRTVASIAADIDSCITPQGNVTVQTSVASAPALFVQKDLDYRVVNSATPVTYTLTYRNNGTAPSTKTWIIDRIADETELLDAQVPEGGQVWFSSKIPPFDPNNPTNPALGLPNALSATFLFSDAVVRAHFQPATNFTTDGLGRDFAIPPAGTRWVAFLVDSATVNDPSTNTPVAVSPPIFPTGLPLELDLHVVVDDPNAAGQLVTNEAAIVSDELLQSIGNRVSFLVSDDPGIDLAKFCPDIVSTSELVEYTITFRNDTTNDDDVVTITDILPAELDIVTDAETEVLFDPAPDDCELNDGGRWECTWTFTDVGTDVTDITIVGELKQYPTVGAPVSGTPITNEVLGVAINGVEPNRVERSFYDACTTIVENPNIQVVKLVDNPEPRSGDTVNYTLEVSNINRREASGITLADTLPAGMDFVGNSLRVLTSGWTLTTGNNAIASIQLQRTGLAAGVIPGLSGPIRLTFQATVQQSVNPGTTLVNTVVALPGTGEDPPACVENVNCPGANTATVPVTTPLPDNYVQLTASTTVKPGEVATWTILYGNDNPEDSNTTVVFFTLPDGPSTPGTADFTLSNVTVPPNVLVYTSGNTITTDAVTHGHPAFDPGNPPGTGWTAYTPGTTPSGVVNHIAFFVKHCDPANPGSCPQGEIYRNQGPFQIGIKTIARLPDVNGTLPGLGQSFIGYAHIAMTAPECANQAACDSDPSVASNGPKAAIVKTPGIGLKVEALCNPNGGYPGVAPGGTTTFEFTFENTGTVPAYGLSFTVDLDDNLVQLFDNAGVVQLKDATDADVNPIGSNGNRLQSALTWTRQGNTFWLGPALGPDDEPQYGIAEGDRGTIRVTAQVDANVLDDTPYLNSVTGTVKGRDDDVPEDAAALVDNTARCGATVYRSDVFVIKSMTNATDPDKTYADGGDNVYVQIEYGNAGHFPADDVVMLDSLAEGLVFANNTVRNVPPGAWLEFDNGSGDWDYQPTGDTDPNVRAIRVRYDDNATMPAPATGVFQQTSVSDFNRGEYAGTVASPTQQAVVLGGGDCTTAADSDDQLRVIWWVPTVKGYWPDGDKALEERIAYIAEVTRSKIDLWYYDSPPPNFANYDTLVLGSGEMFWTFGYYEKVDSIIGPLLKASPDILDNRGSRTVFAAMDADYTMLWGTEGQIVATRTMLANAITWTAGGDGLGLVLLAPSDAYYTKYGEDSIETIPGSFMYELNGSYVFPPSYYDDLRVLDAGKQHPVLANVSPSGLQGSHHGYISFDLAGYTPLADTTASTGEPGTTPVGSVIVVKDGCAGAGNTYTSPEIPSAVEGNVLDWGLLIVNATFGTDEDEEMEIEVFAELPDGEKIIANYELDQGTGTYTFDLGDLVDPADYQKIKVRAVIEGDAGQCMYDILPDVDYVGAATGLSEDGTIIGYFIEPESGHERAFLFDEPTRTPVPLHPRLPRASQEVQPWYSSMAADINDDANATIVVGWAQSDTDQGQYIPADCNVTQTPVTAIYAPAASENTNGAFDTDPLGAGNYVLQWVIPSGDISDSNVTIQTLGLRMDDVGTVASWHYFQGLTVTIGYANDGPLEYGDVNFKSGKTVVFSQDAWAYPNGDAFSFDLNLWLSQAFEYDPTQGRLLIYLTYTSKTDLSLRFEGLSSGITGSTQMMQYTPGTGGYSYRDDAYVATRINNPTYAEDVDRLMVWKESGYGAPWAARCLPNPDLGEFWGVWLDSAVRLPRTASAFVNDSGLIAASAGTWHYLYGGSRKETDPRFGIPTVWCQDPTTSHSSGYTAHPITLWDGSTVEPAMVTGLSENGTVIGVRSHASDGWSYVQAVAWVPAGTDATGCPTSWQEHDLVETVYDVLGNNQEIDDQAIVPLDIHDDGTIVGQYDVYTNVGVGVLAAASTSTRAVAWKMVDGTYEAIDLAIPQTNPDAYLEQVVPPGLVEFHPNNVTAAMVNGVGDLGAIVLQSEDEGRTVTSWTSDGLAPTELTFDDSLFTVATGAHDRQVVGFGANPDTGSITPYYWKAGKATNMGTLVPNVPHVPAFVNTSGLVVGNYFNARGVAQGREVISQEQDVISEGREVVSEAAAIERLSRVFVWRACENTPSLDDWTVTYQTDKNPSWGFEVQVEDICTTNISNAAEISTSTPEITLSNNVSRTSISVNTADLAVDVKLDATVVENDIEGSVLLENLGPGPARDVEFIVSLPEGCLLDYDDFYTDADYESFYDDTLNQLRYVLASVEVGSYNEVEFYCWYDVDPEPDTVVTVSGELASPTIDCNADNDAEAVPVIIGTYPNLWVGIEGPTSTPVNTATPYTLTFGNNGNDDGQGTVTVGLPAGTSFQITACDKEYNQQPEFAAPLPEGCPPNGIDMDVTEPTATTPGSVTFTPSPDWSFEAGVTFIIDFTLTWTDCAAAGRTAVVPAEVSPAQMDANFADNAANTSTLVIAPNGALQLSVSRSDTRVEDEMEILYTFHYANLGAQSASGTELAIEVPSGLVIEAVMPPAPISQDLRKATVGVGRGGGLKALLPGDSGSVVVRARVVGAVGAATLARLYSASGACPVSAEVVPPTVPSPQDPGLHVLVSPSVGSACAPDDDPATPDTTPVTWTVTVTNPGPREAKNTPVTVTIPAGLRYVPGTIAGQGAIDIRAPELIWLATIPAQGALSFTFQTDVLAETPAVLALAASAGTALGQGVLPIECGPRVVVTKTWNLTCGVAGDTFDVAVTVKNLTGQAVTGTLYDTFQVGTKPSRAIDQATRTFAQALPTLLPGKETTVSFTVTVEEPLLYGHPIFDRALFAADTTTQVASNQVAGAVLDCGAPAHCTEFVCAPTVGCQVQDAEPNDTVETCNGIDDNCNDQVDEGLGLGQACSEGDGACRAEGQIVCAVDGTTTCSAVEGTPTTELCNGIDDDCDKTVDNGFNLGAECDGNDADACEDGKLVCDPEDPTTTLCRELGTPKVELCNLADDDCDGATDEDFVLLVGANGPKCDSDAGDTDLCKNDVYACVQGGTVPVCVEAVPFIAEICDGFDNNCDGKADETFLAAPYNLGQACDGDADTDGCKEGVFVCTGDKLGTTCSDNTSDLVEMCNGVDDDCDGKTDETWVSTGDGGDAVVGPYLGASCDGSNDADVCARGKIECNLNFDGVYCHEVDLGVVELCNGKDDTCEGTVDEGFGLTEECTIGVGECRRSGVLVCDPDDNTTSMCNAQVVTGTAEVCDGKDNDCDGRVDNVPSTTTTICKPIETDILTGPPAITSSTTATFTYVNPLATPVPSHITFQCSLDGGAWVTCDHIGANPSLTYNNLPQGQHTLLVRATRGDGAVDETPDFWVWVIDTSVPDTTIVSGPTNPSQNPSGTFTFGSPTPNPSFYSCVLDPVGGVCPATGSAAYAVCPATYPYTNLADGPHTICVYVTNTAGTPDPTPATYTWVIDTVPPETEIVTVIPPKVTSSTTVVFNYIDPTAPTTNTFECSLDGSAWADCDGKTNTYTGLSEGEHVFWVRTVDPNGVVDPTPATYTFVVDLTGPCPTIATHPADPAQSGTAVFGFTASEANVSYFCALDAAVGANGQPAPSAYRPCAATATFSGLEDGTHTLWVYARDAANNLATCRASYTWLIDTDYPETEITSGPPPLSGSGEVAVLEYIDPENEDAITFECKLDGAATWTRCDGTVVGDGGYIEYEGLPVGVHTFEVRTCDFTKAPPVQCDPTPAVHVWEVTVSPCPNDKTSPTLQCAGDLVLECSGGGATVELDGLMPSAVDACAPVSVTTTADESVGIGQTPLVFVGMDGNGNMSSCVTMVSVVDVKAPSITCPADILDATTDGGVCTASVDIGAATGIDACQGTNGLLFVADAPKQFIPGETLVTHHVVDAFGNEATCVQKVVVTDDEPLVLTCSESEVVDAEPDECGWTGTKTAIATDNCSDEITVDVTGTYPVGESPVLFRAEDAAGNSDECTTLLTVRDVTAPTVECGTAIGVVPTVIRATASDACSAVITLENLACARVVDGETTEIALEDCPIAVTGDTIEINSRLTNGVLQITYDATAVDPSGNATTVACSQTYDPDQDADGIIDAEDNCMVKGNGDQSDIDDDGIGDLCDVCPAVADPEQADQDGDGIGDMCSDKDRDEVLDIEDNCVTTPNTDQSDLDEDGDGDLCDPNPYESLKAEGDGSGCAGGAGGLMGGLLGLVGLVVLVLRRRR